MTVREQINKYISQQEIPKRTEIEEIHRRIITNFPDQKLWFFDGKNQEGKIVSNPSIGYGVTITDQPKGGKKEFYRVGLSANATGISIYLMGTDDKNYLRQTYGAVLGKAKITGYCIRFRSVNDINVDLLEEIIENHLTGSTSRGSSA